MRFPAVVQETAPDRTVLWRYVYDLRGNLLKIISAKGMATGSTDEERTGSLYTYNRLGWLMESRIPVSIQDNEIQIVLCCQSHSLYRYDVLILSGLPHHTLVESVLLLEESS